MRRCRAARLFLTACGRGCSARTLSGSPPTIVIALVASELEGFGAGASAEGADAIAPCESLGSLSSLGVPSGGACDEALTGSSGLLPGAAVSCWGLREPGLRGSGDPGESERVGRELRGSLAEMGMFRGNSGSGPQMVVVKAYPTTTADTITSTILTWFKYFILRPGLPYSGLCQNGMLGGCLLKT